MGSTVNYDLNIPSGSDQVNILTQITPNFETIDEVMKENEDASIQVATELFSNNIHALTRTKGDASAMRFTATSNYTAGDTFTVDGVQVTALAPNGTTLPDNAYVIGCEVFAILKGMRLTVWAGSRATDSEKLNGKVASFYATKAEVDNAQELAEGAATLAQNALEKSTIDVLWTNPNTNADFASQTLNLSKALSNYNFIFVEYVLQKGNGSTYSSGLLPIGEYDLVTMSTFLTFFRPFDTRNGLISVDDCRHYKSYGTDSTTVDNGWMIPKKIYGIK